MMRIAVTGATGFAGRRFIEYNKEKYQLLPLPLRKKKPADLDIRGVDSIVHFAGKAHQMDAIDDSIYFEVNYELTRQLADQAKQSGVKQFIYISSTKIYGDDIKTVLNENSPGAPTDPYGASKLKAEQYLQSVETASFKIAIVRPPLVYGPQVKGNMIRLLQLADRNYPLPFGNTGNERSMVFIDNLIELLNTIIDRQAGGVFLAGDPKPVSTDQLIRLIRNSLGNKYPLISVPGFMRSIIQKIRPALYVRLFGSFVADNSITSQLLQFTPPYTTDEGVRQMVEWYKATKTQQESS